MGTLFQDLRYGLRMLVKNPGFTAVAVLTLALGIGANTTIFQLLDAIRLRTLPVRNPQELVEIHLVDRNGWRGSQNSLYPALTNPLWEEVRHYREPFSGLFAWSDTDFNLAPGGSTRLARGIWVSGDFFHLLGVRPVLGRVFTEADDHRGCGAQGAVISYPFWQREFGHDPAVIGRKLTLNYHPVEIIGVTPADFFGLEVGRAFDVAVPICSQPALQTEYNVLDAGTVWWLSVMARLKPGWTLEKATAYLGAVSPGVFQTTLPRDYPQVNVKDYLKFKLAAYLAGTGVSWLRTQYETPLWVLLGLAGMVLLIACANLANLLLAQASTRERDTAVRMALGASRPRLIGQLLAESLLLATAGAALGLLVAMWLGRFLVSFLSAEGNPLFVNLNLDWRLVGFTAGVAGLTCVLFGLTPALRATRIAPITVMKSGSRAATADRERFGLRRALIVSQVALSFVLLTGALLFSRSLANLLSVDPGFREGGILFAYVDFSQLHLPVASRQPFKRQVLEGVRAIPGVDSAAESGVVPLSGSGTDNRVWRDGSARQHGIDSNFNSTGEGYFRTLGIPILAGRDFNDRDTPRSPKVAIVNEAFARKLGLGTNPVGKTFWREATPYEPLTPFAIVGLVKDTKYWGLRQPFEPIAYLPLSQDSQPAVFEEIVIRSEAPTGNLTSRVKSTLAEITPEISVDFLVFKTMIREKLLPERLTAMLSGFFGALAGLLATVGLYGVVSYMVARRTNEIGIRMALGAQRPGILWMILKETLLLVSAGLMIGLPCAVGAARLASSFLFGLRSGDLPTLAAAGFLMLAVALLAGFLPARRAIKVDPMEALRYE